MKGAYLAGRRRPQRIEDEISIVAMILLGYNGPKLKGILSPRKAIMVNAHTKIRRDLLSPYIFSTHSIRSAMYIAITNVALLLKYE